MSSTLIGLIWWGSAGLGIIDALRRPAEDWVYADRQRPLWIILMFFLGPFAALIYLLAIVPRFPRGQEKSNSAFQKDR